MPMSSKRYIEIETIERDRDKDRDKERQYD